MRLMDKVAVIIGGGAAISQATAPRFLEEGAKLLLVEHSAAAFAPVKKLIDENPERVATYVARNTVLAEMEAAMAFAVERFGRIDILLCIAGIIKHKPIEELTVEDWQSVVDVNLTGTFNACKAVVPQMKRQKYGRIVTISSTCGRSFRPGVGVNYAATKAGVVGLTQTLAYELAKTGITVNCVAPGPLNSEMFLTMDETLIAPLVAGIPMGRLGEPAEIAPAILYLASDEAAWTTGEVIDVNGGTVM